jgi:hypothetical protein
VQDEVILELKTVEKLLPIQQAQLLTYLKLAHKRVGRLINCNVPLLSQGIIRRVCKPPFTTETRSHKETKHPSVEKRLSGRGLRIPIFLCVSVTLW